MNRMYGSHGEVKADPTGGATLVAIASLNKWSLSQARDRADVTAFGDGNKVYVQGLPDIKGSVGGWFDSDELTMFYIALGDVAAALDLAPSTLVPTVHWSGKAWLDATIDVAANGAVTVNGSFVAADTWTFAPPPGP